MKDKRSDYSFFRQNTVILDNFFLDFHILLQKSSKSQIDKQKVMSQ